MTTAPVATETAYPGRGSARSDSYGSLRRTDGLPFSKGPAATFCRIQKVNKIQWVIGPIRPG
jgi:hypothetical protein